MIRRPAVAGSFYPADPESLRAAVDSLAEGRTPKDNPRPRALLVPHAGYVYSGRIAARTYLYGALPQRMIVLGPNHTGLGEPIALQAGGAWRTPLGDAPIDAPLAAAILRRLPEARDDEAAHRREHAIEVQLPFLQRWAPALRFVPLCVGTHRLESLLALGRALADAVGEAGEAVLLVLSSDLSHYLPAAEADRLDTLALERTLAIDPEGLLRVVEEHDITMCGVAPAVAGLEAARRLGATQSVLVARGHSGETTGDDASVVGYAGVAIL
jgi:AmmeMemoRadiSam system protein B